MKLLLPITTLCCCLAVVALPSLAEETNDQSASQPATTEESGSEAATEAPEALALDLEEPVLLSGCFLQVECDDSSVISCSGNSSCNTSPNGRCAICDGVSAGCCAKSCCEVCWHYWEFCSNHCGNPIPSCYYCDQTLESCVDKCTGGCY
jgi:hypothetical protein